MAARVLLPTHGKAIPPGALDCASTVNLNTVML